MCLAPIFISRYCYSNIHIQFYCINSFGSTFIHFPPILHLMYFSENMPTLNNTLHGTNVRICCLPASDVFKQLIQSCRGFTQQKFILLSLVLPLPFLFFLHFSLSLSLSLYIHVYILFSFLDDLNGNLRVWDASGRRDKAIHKGEKTKMNARKPKCTQILKILFRFQMKSIQLP